MLLEKELSDFSSDMYLDLIMKFNNNIEFDETNKFAEEEDLRTLSVAHLMNRLEKSLSVSVDKVEKFLHKNLEASDLIRLCHIGIEIANAKCGSNKRRSSAESDESSPNKRKSKEITAKTPIQSSIPTDLERRISEMEYSSHTGPPAEIDDNKKRWLVVGICLHSILSTTLRKYVEPVVTKLYNSLKLSDQIDKQTYTGHLKSYGAVNIKYLNYKAINNNKTTSGNRAPHYDYKVQNAVDLSKLFLEINMVHYKGFNESCDSSALLGIIVNIDKFPGNVQSAAEYVRSEIRNRWAHCNFTEWNSGMYNRSLQKIEDFINLLQLNSPEKSQTIGELNKWKTNGTNYLKDTTLGLELVNDIRQQIQLLVEYEKVICKSADTEFSTVHYELTAIGKTLSQYDKRISTLENNVAIQETTLLNYKSLYDAEPVINSWKKKMKLFVETDVVIDILEILQGNHCALLIGVSGMGKTITAQHIALHLWHEMEYSIVPCSNLNDIQMRYRDNVNQVFFLDDICGRYTTNIQKIENWMSIEEFVQCILVKGKTKILATCRTEVFLEEIFQATFELFNKTTYNLSEKYSFKDKLVIAGKYLKQDEEMLSATIRNVKFTPLMCFLYAQHEHFDINDFLNSPFKTFCKEWNKLKVFDKEKFCVLFLCVLYNATIDESIVDVSTELDQDEKRKLADIFECCKLGRDTSRLVIKDKLDACIDTYFIKEDREYKVIHDKMFDFLCSYFGKTLLTAILKYADDKVICERVQLESLQKAHGYFTIIVSAKDEHKYNDRIKTDLENGKVHCCLNNMQMKYNEYRIKFRDILKDLEYNLVRNLIKSKDDNGINAFIISCLRGYDELVDFFISVGADVDGQIGFFTPLTAACHDGHLQTVEILLKEGSNINNTNTQGETPLYTACFEGHYSLVNYLIDKEAEINKQNKFSRTPLHASCMMNHATIVNLLIDKGANVFKYKDLLIAATLGGNDKIVERLISKDCCLNSVDIEGKTALFIACEEGYTKIVKLLIDNNADIYIVDNEGKTPLHAACCVGNNDMVSMFISKDSDLNMIDVTLETPLHKACRKGSIDVIQNLLAFGADINKTNRDVYTPAHIARTEGGIVDEHILIALEKNEIVPTEKQNLAKNNKNEFTNNLLEYGWTPLYEACVNGDIGTVQSLIRDRANVNMKTFSGEMPLVVVCQQGHGFLLQVLLDKGADVDEALCCAIRKGYDRTIKLLLYKGGKVGYKGVDGKSLLTLAYEQSSVKVVKLLLEKGADFNDMDLNWHTLLKNACNTDIVDLLQLLIDKGLHLTMYDKNGRFPLFVSLEKGFDDLSRCLIKQSGPIATSKKDIETALISTFESGNMELSNLLVSNGYLENVSLFNKTMLYHAYRLGMREKVEIQRNWLNIKEKYKYGYTPMILADIGGNNDLSDYLQNSMCSIRNTSISNNMIGLRMEEKNDFVTYNCWNLEEYEYLFQALMNGEVKSGLFEILGKRPRYYFDIFIETGEPNVSIWFEQTPLCLAIRRGHTKVVQFLIKHGVDVNLTFEELKAKDDVSLSMTIRYGYTPLFAACQRKYYEIVDMMLEKGANLNKALYDACREGYLDTVQFLLQKGANVNSISRYSQTPLFGACIGGYSAIVKFLIDQGAGINTKVKIEHVLNEITCTHAAYLCGNHDIVKLLISRGASVNAVGNFRRTLLHYACRDGNYEIVKKLLDERVDVDASDVYGATPLMACLLQDEEEDRFEKDFIDEIKRKFCFTFQKDSLDQMPKEDTCYQLQDDYFHRWRVFKQLGIERNYKRLTEDHYSVVQLLVEHKADIDKADRSGTTPRIFAHRVKNTRLIEMFYVMHPEWIRPLLMEINQTDIEL